MGFYWKAPDGGEVEHLVTVEDALILGGGETWSPDGNLMAFFYSIRGTGFDIGLLSFEGEPRWAPLLQTEANETNAVISPDGRWLAYSSNETGQYEVYVQRFPELGGRQQISTSGGRDPLWSSDGRELFYRVLTPRALMAVTVESDDTSVMIGTPEVLFEDPYFFGVGRHYNVAPDGRFLMLSSELTDASNSTYVTLVQNWTQELLERVPVP